MKKLLLLALFAIPAMTMAQTWDFTNDNGGWEGASGASLIPGATASTLDYNADKSPKIRREDGNGAGVESSEVFIAAITIKNPSDAALMKVKYDKLATGSGTRSVNTEITSGSDEFITYYVDLSNAEWDNNGVGGVQDNIEITFKSADNMNIATAGTVDFDKVEFLDAIPTEPRLVYNFDTDGDNEGWRGISGTTETVAGGVLNLDFDGSTSPRIAQESFNVDADANQYVNITLQNNSATDDQMRVSYPKTGGGRVFKNTIITTADSEFTTYQVDLSNADWTGVVEDIQIQFRNEAAGASDGTGNVDIDSIEFNNEEVLGLEDTVARTFDLYPNPASGQVLLNSSSTLNEVSIYNVAGQLVQSSQLVGDKLDISRLNSGVYFIQVTDDANQTATKKLVVRN
ncbi:T9SS type A sorting domain-containing protein [Dokdonia sinensis]|nr:T9SS type A sorting domain-containing protein [Dokdonia sinensis]